MLRRGQAHILQPGGDRLSVPCRLLDSNAPQAYLCIPLVAQGITVGVLRLSHTAQEPPDMDTLQGTAQSLARQVALALANLQLRESLQMQSIRDPLTGLHNRRYLEETLEREMHRAQRSLTPLAVLVIDVDYFKGFNDTFGHDAGDMVLQELGRTMRQAFREEDVICRYGGEEFVVALLDTDETNAVARAEVFRKMVEHLSVTFREQALPPVTVSIGVAGLRHENSRPEELIRAADQALYQAKRTGRNRVVSSTPGTSPD